MNSLKAMYGCCLNFFIKLAYNLLFYISFAFIFNIFEAMVNLNRIKVVLVEQGKSGK